MSEVDTKPKWHLIYFALAAFDILAVGMSLTLNHQIMGIYESSVQVNREWAMRSRELGELSVLAQKTNAPGNDVFDSRDVMRERETRDEYLSRFKEKWAEIFADIHANVEPREAEIFLVELDEISKAMHAMVQNADGIFRHFENGEAELAGRLMATMDRSYGELSFAISLTISHVQDIQGRHLARQVETASAIRRFEYVLGGMIVLMVVCVAVYGNKIGRTMRLYHEELHASKQRSDSVARELASQNEQLAEAKSKLEHISMHDFLSGLPNRRGLEHFFENGPGCSDLIAVLHIDLDRFKQINDTLGHDAGDHVIVSASQTIQECCGKGDFVARVGGDEFVVITRYGNRFEHPLVLAEKIVQRIREPIPYQDQELRIGASIGIACQDDVETTGKSLIIKADIALYRAKHLGRNRFEFFTEELHQQVINKQRTIDDLRLAVENEDFVPHYQIQVDATSLEVVGVEALARMVHPVRGVLAPAAFLDEAEEIGVVDEIDRIIFQKASRDFSSWKAAGIPVPRVSLNLSAKRLARADLVDHCRQSSFGPGELSFELVETVFLDDPDQSILNVIQELRSLGIGIEIDDFGTGHASILSVLSISPSMLKLDRGLTSSMVGSKAQTNLVQSIVEFGHSLGIEVIAEGVETEEQAEVLRDVGCRYLQGYAFSRPVPADAIADVVKGQNQVVTLSPPRAVS